MSSSNKKDKASQKIKRFDLWEREKRDLPFNWSGEDLDPIVLDRLGEGDIVRLFLQDPKELGTTCWEKIYFEIIEVQYYQKKSKQHKAPRPRKFKGRAMDTYCPSEHFVKTGEVISFGRRNVLEVPGWVGEHKLMPQQCRDLISQHLKAEADYGARQEERQWRLSQAEKEKRRACSLDQR